MAKPVNVLTPDAPDSENPDKPVKQVKPGSGIKVNPLPPAPKPKRYAKGGSVSSRADGIAQRGKTKGKVV